MSSFFKTSIPKANPDVKKLVIIFIHRNQSFLSPTVGITHSHLKMHMPKMLISQMRDICYNKWNKQKRLLYFEIWESETFKLCLRKSAKAKASCLFEFLGWGPPVLGELQLMNLSPQNFLFFCAFIMYTQPGHFTDVCGVKERRQAGGRGERREDKPARRGGKGKDVWEKECMLSYKAIVELSVAGDNFEASSPWPQRRESTKRQNFSFLSKSYSKCQTPQWSLNFTWVYSHTTLSMLDPSISPGCGH